MFELKNLDFIKNRDILDEIINRNSIGVFIDCNDEFNDKNKKYIKNALKRLNKFIKKPKLYIFSKNNNIKLDTFVVYEIVNIYNPKEEYCFLSNCKHHIILDTEKSYSMNFCSSIVFQKEYSYAVYGRIKSAKINIIFLNGCLLNKIIQAAV